MVEKMKLLTAKQIRQKYKGKYVDIYETFEKNNKGETLYEVRAVYDKIMENTTRAEDVGTPYEYCR